MARSLLCADDWRGGFAVDQPMKPVKDMRFGRQAVLQRQFHRYQDRLFVMMQNQCQEWTAKQVVRPLNLFDHNRA